MWALTRIDGPSARAANRIALTDRDDSVRHAAIHAAGLWRDAGSLDQLASAVASGAPAIARAAAEALGRIGDARAVPPIIAAAASSGGDRVLEHSLTYALIEIGNPAATVGSRARDGHRTAGAARGVDRPRPDGRDISSTR